MRQVQRLQKEQMIKRPKIKAGDIVSVSQNIEEGGKKRTQVFKGIIIKVQGAGISKTFTVRRVSFGVGIERTYPLYHPQISKIKIKKSSRIRRAKLYYLRGKKGKSARLKEKAMSEEAIKSMKELEEAGRIEKGHKKEKEQEPMPKQEPKKSEKKQEENKKEQKEEPVVMKEKEKGKKELAEDKGDENETKNSEEKISEKSGEGTKAQAGAKT